MGGNVLHMLTMRRLQEGAAAAAGALTAAPQSCTLVEGSFDKFVQFLLACLSLAVLIVKRWREHPRRPLTVWMLDTSKQCFGAGMAHLSNLVISIYFAEKGHADECAIYFVNFVLDTTVGVLISYLFLKATQKAALAMGMRDLVRSGYYGEVPSLRAWGEQVAVWLLITFSSKLVISGIIYALWGPLNAAASAAFAGFEGRRRVELILVMIIAPTFLNGLQFWIQDNFLKADDQGYNERLPLMKIDIPAHKVTPHVRRRPPTPQGGNGSTDSLTPTHGGAQVSTTHAAKRVD